MIDSLKQKTVGGMIWNFGDLLVSQGMTLIMQIVLARLLLPEDFGIVGIVTVFISVAQTIVDSGFTNAMIRDLKTTQEDYSTVFFFNIIISIVMYVLLFVSAGFIGDFYREPSLVLIIRTLSIVLVINSFGLIQRTILTKKVDFKSQTIINIISYVVSGVAAILLAMRGYGVWSLVYYSIIRQCLQSVLYSFAERWHPTLTFRLESFKRFYTFGWKLLISALIDTLYSNINNLIIGKLYNKGALGYYTNANKLSNVASQSLNGAISKVTYPVLSMLQDDEEHLRNGYRKIILNIVFINFPLMVGLIVIAKPLVMLLLGPKWIPVIAYFQILCIPGIIYPLQSINLNILQVKGRSDLFLRITIIKKIVSTIAIALVIIFKLNILTLLWIGAADSLITFCINSYYSGRILNYSTWNQIRDIFPTLLAALMMGGTVYYLGTFMMLNYFMDIILKVSIGILSYILLCKILRIKELDGIWKVVLKFISS